MSLQKHARRHTQRAFDEPSRYGAPPGWVTPEIPPGYFNNTGRFQDTPESSEARTSSSMQQTPISGNTSFVTRGLQQGQQYPQQQMFSFPSAESQGQEAVDGLQQGFHQSLRQHQSSVLQKRLRREDQAKETEILATLAGSKVQDMSHIDRSNLTMNLRGDSRTTRDGDLCQHCSLQEMHCCMCQG